MTKNTGNFKCNLLSQRDIQKKVKQLQENGKKVVFTNGVFDILHVGHLTYLEEARELGDVLIVGVNSDKSVKTNKGDKRPINPEKNRAEMLLGLKFVDFTVIFDEKTPENLLDLLKPDIHVKGGDYKKEDLPETEIVEKNGGEVKILSFVDNISTTEIINKIIENGWSRAVLLNFLDTNLYERQGTAINNFQESLPNVQSNLAKEITKDSYNFDFISIREEYNEKELCFETLFSV